MLPRFLMLWLGLLGTKGFVFIPYQNGGSLKERAKILTDKFEWDKQVPTFQVDQLIEELHFEYPSVIESWKVSIPKL